MELLLAVPLGVQRPPRQVYTGGGMLLLWVDSETYLKVVRGRDELLHLLASEDINCSKVALGVTVFAGLGGGDLDDLRAYGRISTIALHVKTLRQRRALVR